PHITPRALPDALPIYRRRAPERRRRDHPAGPAWAAHRRRTFNPPRRRWTARTRELDGARGAEELVSTHLAVGGRRGHVAPLLVRSEEHTSELQSREKL